MAGPSAADDVVARCRRGTAGVAGSYFLHALRVFEHGFHSPETPAGKNRETIGAVAAFFVDRGRRNSGSGCVAARGEEEEGGPYSFSHKLNATLARVAKDQNDRKEMQIPLLG